MSGDITRIDQWLYATMLDDLTLSDAVGGRIYADLAPQGAQTPMVVFAFMGGADKTITFGSRFTHALYLIRAIAQGSSYDALEEIADRLDDILTVPSQGLIIRDIRIASCAREQPHQRRDMENGVPIVYLGGFYRVRYQPYGI